MSEDRTIDMDGRSFEERVFARFDALDVRFNEIDSRLTTLEDKVDRRLKETRPIWEQVLSRLDKVEERLSAVDDSLRNVGRKFDVVAKDLIEVRADQRYLENRLDKLESR
jgi:DNA repair exonuclease SbcCD ATPase subunit